MNRIEEEILCKFVCKPEEYYIYLIGDAHYTLTAEKKTIHSWLRANFLERQQYNLANIIFRIRENKKLSPEFIAAVDSVVNRYNQNLGRPKILTLSEQRAVYNEWHLLLIKFLLEKFKAGAVLEIIYKDHQKQVVEFSHFEEHVRLIARPITRQQKIVITEKEIRSIKILAYGMSQWALLSHTVLPGVDSRARGYLKNRGVLFHDRSQVHLPKAWKKVPREHPLWIDLFDDEGKKVGELFHKREPSEEISKFYLTVSH